MTECDLDFSVPDWIIEHPETLAVFQELGVDYSCGGKSLEFACRERQLDVHSVLSKLHRSIRLARITTPEVQRRTEADTLVGGLTDGDSPRKPR